MVDEPRNHKGFMILLALVCVMTVPFLFVGVSASFWLGLPIWLWWSMGWTLVLSALTAWGILYYWNDDNDG
jgi:hypothetical protein